MESFAALGLSAPMLRTIEAQSFTEPTPIQAQAIPPLLAGRDILGTAQTGQGKTAAYLLPILDKLAAEGAASLPNRPRVLILTPTRELAIQIANVLRDFTKGHRLYYTAIYGGMPFVAQRQVLEKGVHFLVATPGRLMDHISRRSLVLDKVDTLVLDEADRMLDMGFVDAVKEIAGALPKNRQTMMFSATMNRGVRNLAGGLLNNPVSLDVGQENGVAVNVDHRVMRVKYPDKKPLLLHLLARPDVTRVLVFTRTKVMADMLVDDIREAGLKAQAIHGDKEQSERQRVLRGFRMGTVNILVATDVAARGIDVPDITHVINYDMPLEADAYVHRVGRTGRAGSRGTALSICDHNEGNLIRNVERAIGQPIPVDAEQPFHDARPDGRGGAGFVNNRRSANGKPAGGKPGSFAKSNRGDHRDSRGAKGGEAHHEYRSAKATPDREYRSAKADRPAREYTAAKSDGGERSYRSGKAERPARGEGWKGKAAKPERPAGRPEHSERAATPERAAPMEGWSPVGRPSDRAVPEMPRGFAETAKRVDSFNARGGSYQDNEMPADRPAFKKKAFEKPAFERKAGSDKPAYGKKASHEKPAYDKPAYDKPAYDKPARAKKAFHEKPAAGRKDRSEEGGFAGKKPGARSLKPAAFAKRASRSAFDMAARGERPAPVAEAAERPTHSAPRPAKPAAGRFKPASEGRFKPASEGRFKKAGTEGRFKKTAGKPKRPAVGAAGQAPLKRKKRPSA